jgi:hypothetical protein
MSYRARDSQVEQEISAFLDSYFYPKKANDFVRYNSKEDQLAGKDVSFSMSNAGSIIVDEKAATHYINKNIPTFAFELSFLLSSGSEVQGWLLDRSKVTEYYFLMWITAEKTWDLKKEDIKEIQATLVSRKKIINYLSSITYDADKLQRANDKIRRNMLDGPLGKTYDSDIYFFSTQRLVEKPINIVIKRKRLESLSLKNYKITKEEIIENEQIRT